jgi:hypothetical protein
MLHGDDLLSLAEQAGLPEDELLDCSASINPLGPSLWLRDVLARVAHYPDPHERELLAAASEAILPCPGTEALSHRLPQDLGTKPVAAGDNQIWGSYVHGLFDNDAFRHRFLDQARARLGLPPESKRPCFDLEPALDRLADTLRRSSTSPPCIAGWDYPDGRRSRYGERRRRRRSASPCRGAEARGAGLVRAGRDARPSGAVASASSR